MAEPRTKPGIVLRVGKPPVVEQLVCEDVDREMGEGTVSAVTLDALYKIVGGNLVDFARPIPEEVAALESELGVTLLSGQAGFFVVLAVHDEGMVRGFPVNARATRLYPGRHVWSIHGDAVLVEVD